MKKALFVLLLLAFVAGGLFAQFSFSGHVNSGLVLSILDAEDDAQLGVIGKADGAGGGRYQFQASATNEAKNAGLVIRFRFAASANNTIQPRAVYGWLKFFDGVLTTYAGRFGGGSAIFSSFDPLSDGENYYDNTTGLFALLKPIDMLSIGFIGSLPNGTGFTGMKFAKAQGTVVLGVAIPDIMNINAQFAFNQGADTAAKAGYVGWDASVPEAIWVPAVPAVANGSANIRAFVSFDVTAIKNFALQVTMQMNGLQDFKGGGNMIFSEFFAFNGIENLGLNLGFQEGISGVSSDDMFFKAWFWATYALGNIVPRLDFAFAMGGSGMVDNLYNNSWFKNLSFSKDDINMIIMPSVQFKVGGNFIEVGYGLEKGLGKNGYFEKANHYLFIDLCTNL